MTKQENFTGNDCSGTNGTQNRVLTLSNTSYTDNNNFQIYLNNSFLHLNTDYTIEHKSSSTEVTFLLRVWNQQPITAIYKDIISVVGKLISEDYDGSDCTGSSGDEDRTLTISNTSLTYQDNFQVYVDNSFLHLNVDYTVSHNTSGTVITFLHILTDSQDINVRYSSKSTGLTNVKPILPLDTDFSNKEINYLGDSIRIRKVTKLDKDVRGNSQNVLGNSKITYISGDDSLSSFYSTTYLAQTFTTSDSFNVSSVKIKIKRTGTPGSITIGIKNVDSNNKPTGSYLTSETLDYTDLIDDGSTEWSVFQLDYYTLSANTMYSIVMSSSGGDSSNKYEARIVSTGTYSGGNILTSSNSGSTWTAGSSDILFEIFGDTDTTAVVEVLTSSDESVKSGQFQSGDIRLFLQNSESISRQDLIYYDSNWFSVKDLIKFSQGNTVYSIEATCSKI